MTMLNLVAYNAEAQYDDAQQEPCSGADAYLKRYAPAFNAVAAELGVKGVELVYVGAVARTLVGPTEPRWDAVALVRYPSYAALRTILESREYAEKAEPHRRAALSSWQFMATT